VVHGFWKNKQERVMRVISTTVLFLFCTLAAIVNLTLAETPAEQNKIRVLVTYGGHGFAEKPFWAMIDALPNVVYSKAKLPQQMDMLKPGLEKDFDVIVRYDMTPPVKLEQEKAFVELLNRGIGLVGLHHNLDAHKDWVEYRHILGGAYLFKPWEFEGKTYGPSHWIDDQDMKVTVADRQHPIMAGIEDFQIHDEAYREYYTASDVNVLLTTNHPKNDPKVAWTKTYGNSRVFYMMFGHGPTAWQNPVYPRILINAIHWAAKK
jgi:uncharacterized protein